MAVAGSEVTPAVGAPEVVGGGRKRRATRVRIAKWQRPRRHPQTPGDFARLAESEAKRDRRADRNSRWADWGGMKWVGAHA